MDGVFDWESVKGLRDIKTASELCARRAVLATRPILGYGDTLIVTALLTTFPIVAVMITLPPVVMPDTSNTTPSATVARFVLFDVQVATSVTGNDPLQVSASADKSSSVLLPVNGAALVGVT